MPKSRSIPTEGENDAPAERGSVQDPNDLLEAALLYQQVIQSARDGIIVYDRELRYLLWNPFMESLSGVKAADVLGRHALEVFPFLLGTQVPEMVQRALQGETTEPMEFPFSIPPTGRSGWVSDTAAPLRDTKGNVIGAISIVRDITEQRRAQEGMRTSEARFRSLFASMSEGMVLHEIVLGPDGEPQNYIILDVNPAFERHTGVHRDEVVGRPGTEAYGTPVAPYLDIFGHVAMAGEPRNVEVYFAPMQRHFRISVFRPQAGQFATVFEDITARKRSEEELRQAKEAAEAASRAKDQFIAVLSHELRTPLAPVLATVDLLQQSPDLNPGVRSSLEMIQRNVELESSLIGDLLDVTRIARGELRLERVATDAHESLRAALDICQPQITSRHHEVVLDLQARRSQLRADPVRLRQVFWNLLGNAIKYTPEGGHILVRTSDIADRRLRIQVTDSGIGMDADVLAKIFQPFVQGEQTLGRRFGGLGLGLSISRALVEAHGGILTASSPGKGQGATFTVELPVLPLPVRSSPPLAPAPSSSRRTARILLVEDSEDTIRVMRQVLMLSGHQVQTAATVSAALKRAADWEFDLLLCDIGLPDGTGWELLQQLSAIRPVKALALSGFAADEDIQRSKASGFLCHLIKPIRRDQLERAIAEALD